MDCIRPLHCLTRRGVNIRIAWATGFVRDERDANRLNLGLSYGFAIVYTERYQANKVPTYDILPYPAPCKTQQLISKPILRHPMHTWLGGP